MNAKELSEKLAKMADEAKVKSNDKQYDLVDRAIFSGEYIGYHMASVELLGAIDKGDIR